MKPSNHRALIGLVGLVVLYSTIPLAAQSEIVKLEATASYYGDEFQGRPTSSGELFDMNAFTAAHKTLPFGTMLEVTNLANGKKVIVRVNDRGPFVDTRELDISKAAAAKIGMLETGTARVSIRKIAGPDTAVAYAATGETTAASASAGIGETIATTATTTTTTTTATAATNVPTPVPVASPAPIPASASTPVNTTTNEPVMIVPASQPAQTAQPAKQVLPVQTIANPTLGEKASGVNWRIQLGSFSNEENANRLVIRLRNDGFNPAFEKTGTLTRVVIAGIPDRDLAATRTRLDSAGYGQYLVRQESW